MYSVVILTEGKNVLIDKKEVYCVPILINWLLNWCGDRKFEILIGTSEKNMNLVQNKISNISSNYQSHVKIQIHAFGNPFNYSYRCNYLISKASGKFINLMNDDLLPLSKPDYSRIEESLLNDEIFAIGPALLNNNLTLQNAGDLVSKDKLHHFLNGTAIGDLPYLFHFQREVSSITGAWMIFEKDKFIKVGKFDEQLEVEYNDIDLCLRANELGYRNVINPNLRLIHFESNTRGKSSSKKSKEYFLSKHTLPEHDPYWLSL